jgi:large subunit ribosomal protein L29
MKMIEIKELTTKELQERIDAEKATLVKLKMNHAVSPLDNPLKIKHVRIIIAQMMTEMSKRKIENKK